jgi:hypothetical protein
VTRGITRYKGFAGGLLHGAWLPYFKGRFGM